MFGVVAAPGLKPLDGAVDALASLDPADLDGEDAAELLVELRRVTAKLAAVEARLVAAVDRDRPWAEAGYRSTANWLAASDNTSMADAHATVRLARRLRSMPATAAALVAGDITRAHAERLATLAGPDTAEEFARSEEMLVGQARSMRWADFTKACAYWLRHARPDGPDPDAADHAHRHVTIHEGLRGTGLLEGELTPVAKATIGAELARIEAELFAADWAAAQAVHGDATTTAHLARTPRQRRHDALVEMATRSATAPADGKRPRPLVSVLVGAEAFAKVCELADGTVISPGTVASLADEMVVERIVMDGPSRVLDIGRARSFVGAARRAVEIVDRRCTLGPACDVPAERCEIDHVWRSTTACGSDHLPAATGRDHPGPGRGPGRSGSHGSSCSAAASPTASATTPPGRRTERGPSDHVSGASTGSARRGGTRSGSVAPGPSTGSRSCGATGSPHAEHVGTISARCPQVRCTVSTGGPAGAAQRSPHCRMAVATVHRSRPLGVSR